MKMIESFAGKSIHIMRANLKTSAKKLFYDFFRKLLHSPIFNETTLNEQVAQNWKFFENNKFVSRLTQTQKISLQNQIDDEWLSGQLEDT